MFRARLCLVMFVISILLRAIPAQGEQGNVAVDYRASVPKWSEGDSWSLECSGLALQKDVPTRRCYGRAKMTVVQTPGEGSGNFVISIVPDDRLVVASIEKANVLVTLDQNDLSLLEVKFVGRTDPNDTRVEKYAGHGIKGIHVGMLRITLPVLSTSTDIDEKDIYYDMESRCATKASIITFEGEDALVLHGVCSSWTNEDFLARLKEGGYNYRLLWKKGDPWWTSRTALPNGWYRAELVRRDDELSDANSVGEKFAILHERWKKAEAEGRKIESDELYYDIAGLGREAVPYIISRIEKGQKTWIRAFSEITGGVAREATIAECLEYWARIKKWYALPSEK